MKGMTEETINGFTVWTCDDCGGAFTDGFEAREHLDKAKCMGGAFTSMAWGGGPAPRKAGKPVPKAPVNHVYVIAGPTGTGTSGLKCECGESFGAGWDGRRKARKHEESDCREPKVWGPDAVLPAEAEERALLEDELLHALDAARREGRSEGFYQGAAAARDAVARVREQAAVWGNKELSAVDVVLSQLDVVVMKAEEKRPPE